MVIRIGWVVLLGATVIGCPQGPFQPNEAESDEDDAKRRKVAAGASCAGVGDCPRGQICVEGSCRYRDTSVAGEVLASAGQAQLDAGDFAGAVRTFDEAVDAYETAGAPIPPEVLCGAALAALQEGPSQDARERAATRADACLRGSLPGDPGRDKVLESLTRLRYEGLDPTLFDREEPAQRFFTKEPSRPTVDAIDIGIELPEVDEKGFDEASEAMRGEDARRAIADCFIQDWDLNHDRQVSASLLLELSASVEHKPYYDVYEPEAEVKQTTLAQDGFEPCVAGALTAVLEDALPKNVGRRVEWQQAFEVSARLQ